MPINFRAVGVVVSPYGIKASVYVALYDRHRINCGFGD